MSGGCCVWPIEPVNPYPAAATMEHLLLGGGGHSVQRAASSGLFRSTSTVGNVSTQDSEEQWSDDGSCLGSASRRITLAKRVLAEATHTFTPCLSINAAKSDKCRNTGALGPLLCMIQSESEPDALRRCLDTLSFLLLDKANRKLVAELGGLNMLLALLAGCQHADLALLRLMLDCVVSLAKVDDAEKERVWAHPAKLRILSLISPKVGAHQLLEILLLTRKLAFRGTPGGPMELIEPQVLLAVADLLAQQGPAMAPAVLLKCCKLLKACADCACREHLHEWHAVLQQLAALLRSAPVPEGMLDVLGSLCEHTSFRNLIVAVGGIPPLIALLASPAQPVATKAAGLVGSLSEGGLSRDQLCEDACVAALVRALPAAARHVDTACGAVYALANLAKYSPRVGARLVAWGVPQQLCTLAGSWTDTGLLLAAEQLLQALDAVEPPAQLTSTPASVPPSAAGPTAASQPGMQQVHADLPAAGAAERPLEFPLLRSSSSGQEQQASFLSAEMLQLLRAGVAQREGSSSSQQSDADVLLLLQAPAASACEQCPELTLAHLPMGEIAHLQPQGSGSGCALLGDSAPAEERPGAYPLCPHQQRSQRHDSSCSIDRSLSPCCECLLSASISNVTEATRASSPAPAAAAAARAVRQQSLPQPLQQPRRHVLCVLPSHLDLQGAASDAAHQLPVLAEASCSEFLDASTTFLAASTQAAAHPEEECDPLQPHDGPCSCKDHAGHHWQQQQEELLLGSKPSLKHYLSASHA